MKTQSQTKPIAELIEAGKQQFGDFNQVKKQEIFLCIKEAKARGLLRKQARDLCLSEYINAANYLLRTYSTDEFERALTQSLDYIYVYAALVSTNSILTTAWRARTDSASETPLNKGESRDEWRFKNEISLVAILAS